MDKLPRAGGNLALLISASTYEALRAAALAGAVALDPTQFEAITRAGKTFYRLRQPGAPEGGARGGKGGGFGAFTPAMGGSLEDGWTVTITPGILRLSGSGEPVTVTDLAEEFEAASGDRIYLEAEVDGAGVVTGVTAHVGTDWADTTQVEFSGTSPFAQTHARLELGVVEADGPVLTIADGWESGNIAVVSAIFAGRVVKLLVPGN